MGVFDATDDSPSFMIVCSIVLLLSFLVNVLDIDKLKAEDVGGKMVVANKQQEYDSTEDDRDVVDAKNGFSVFSLLWLPR